MYRILFLVTCLGLQSIAAESVSSGPSVKKKPCPELTCPNRCVEGYQVDADGCMTCYCKNEVKVNTTRKPCLPVMCKMLCPNGFETDANGCEVCRCKPVCSNVACGMHCEHGFARDSNGCLKCECKAPPAVHETTCRPVLCRMFCRYGWQRNEDGCEICKCKDPPVEISTKGPAAGCQGPQPMCAIECKHGYETDANGCMTCVCKEAPNQPVSCKPVMCYMYCQYGWQKDSNGCDMCRCNRPPTAKPSCSPVACMMHCPNGFVQDPNGCDTCKCKPPARLPVVQKPKACPPYMCMMHCPNGFVKDTNGCDMCRCKPSATVPTSGHKCPMFKCVPCQYGYQHDEHGCQTCECLPKPAQEKPCNLIDCPRGTTCVDIDTKAVCKPPPICLQSNVAKEHFVPVLLRGIPHVPTCDNEGEYSPKQCINDSTCWCVDDRGHPVEGTLRTQSTASHKCDYNRTESIDVKLDLKHKLLGLNEQMEGFRRAFHKVIERWLNLRRDYISNIEIEPQTSEMVEISFRATDDGQTRLASAAVYMTNEITEQTTPIEYGGASFSPLPQSLSVKHHYPPNKILCKDRSWYKRWMDENIHIMVGGAILLVCLIICITVAIMLIRKRRALDKRPQISTIYKGPRYHKVQKVPV